MSPICHRRDRFLEETEQPQRLPQVLECPRAVLCWDKAEGVSLDKLLKNKVLKQVAIDERVATPRVVMCWDKIERVGLAWISPQKRGFKIGCN